MPWFRFSLLQLCWLMVLCGLLFAVMAAARHSHQRSRCKLHLSPDGRWLARAFVDRVQVWDLSQPSPRLLPTIPHQIEIVGFVDRETLVGLHQSNDEFQLVSINVRDGTSSATPWPFSSPPKGMSRTRRLLWTDSPLPNGNLRVDVFDLDRQSPGGSIRDIDSETRRALADNGQSLVTSHSSHVANSIANAPPHNRVKVFRVEDGSEAISLDVSEGGVLNNGYSRALAVSSNGGRIAIVDLVQGKWTGSFIRLYSGQNGQMLAAEPLSNQQVRAMSFSTDEQQLLVQSDHSAELWDAKLSKRIAQVRLPRRSWQGVHLSADAGRVVIHHANGSLTVHDLSGRVTVIASDMSFHLGLLFLFGLLLWPFGWRRLRRRPPVESRPLRPEPDFLPAIARWRMLALWLLGMGGVLAVLVVSQTYLDFVGTFWMWMGALTPLLMAGLLAVGYGVAWLLTRWLGPTLIWRTWLRRLTGDHGVTELGYDLTAWFAGRNEIEDTWRQACHEVLQRASEFSGEAACFGRSVLLVGLDRTCDYEAFLGRRMSAASAVVEVPGGHLVVVCQETADRLLMRPDQALRLALAGLIVSQRKPIAAVPWLANVYKFALAVDSSRAVDLRRSHRRLRSRLANCDPTGLREVFQPASPSRRQFVFPAHPGFGAYRFRDCADLYLSLAEFLLGPFVAPERRQPLLEIWRAPPAERLEAAFTQRIGQTRADLLAGWRDWVLADEVAEHEPPPPDVLAKLRRLATETLLDANGDERVRRQTALDVGAAGYWPAFEPLVALLDDANRSVRAGSLVALESLTNQRLGESADAWRAWWESQPAAVREPSLLAGAASDRNPGAMRVRSRPASPPMAMVECWGVLAAGGFVAIVLALVMLFVAGLGWRWCFLLPTGTLLLTAGVCRWRQPLIALSVLQMSCGLACDPFNLLFGILLLGNSLRPDVQSYSQSGQ